MMPGKVVEIRNREREHRELQVQPSACGWNIYAVLLLVLVLLVLAFVISSFCLVCLSPYLCGGNCRFDDVARYGAIDEGKGRRQGTERVRVMMLLYDV